MKINILFNRLLIVRVFSHGNNKPIIPRLHFGVTLKRIRCTKLEPFFTKAKNSIIILITQVCNLIVHRMYYNKFPIVRAALFSTHCLRIYFQNLRNICVDKNSYFNSTLTERNKASTYHLHFNYLSRHIHTHRQIFSKSHGEISKIHQCQFTPSLRHYKLVCSSPPRNITNRQPPHSLLTTLL